MRLNDMKTHMKSPTLAVRVDPDNPDHHLWNNNGTWWCHYTIHGPDHTKERVRISLKTSNQEEARRRRDHVFRAHEAQASVLN